MLFLSIISSELLDAVSRCVIRFSVIASLIGFRLLCRPRDIDFLHPQTQGLGVRNPCWPLYRIRRVEKTPERAGFVCAVFYCLAAATGMKSVNLVCEVGIIDVDIPFVVA